MMPSEPNVRRVLLRVEMADGQFREFVARDPYGVGLEVTRSDPFAGVEDISMPPAYITSGEVTSVKIEFKASRAHRAPITISTNDASGETCTRCGASSAFWEPQHRQAI